MQKIHVKLKWSTIIDRLNKVAGFEKFKISQTGEIYKKLSNDNAFIFIANILFDKQNFIEQYV